MDVSESYQVKLEVFEGPLDLLLFLIRNKKIEIHDIPMATITKEYLEYLEKKDKINLEREAEFLLMAALLIYIKSQMLLPRETVEDSGDDPRQILVERLLDYQNIKAASMILREKEEHQLLKWKRSFSSVPISDDEVGHVEVTLFDLAEAFFILMKKNEKTASLVIQGKKVSLKEKMTEILEHLEKQGALDFSDYFTQQDTLEEALVSLLCLLELVKARIVVALQEKLFSPIKVWLRNVNR